MTKEIIDSESANEALRIVRHLEPKYRITEVPNPAYKRYKKERESFIPTKGSIRQTDKALQPSLGDQMRNREKRLEVSLLAYIKEVCDYCPDCQDCTFGYEARSADRCERVKRNLKYRGVIEG